MNSIARTAHPLLSVLYLGLGVIAAVTGIWTFAAVDFTVVQGLGFLLLAPAGAWMAIGLCQLWERGCQSGKLALPPIPPAFRRPVSLQKAVRSMLRTGKRKRQDSEPRRLSWAE